MRKITKLTLFAVCGFVALASGKSLKQMLATKENAPTALVQTGHCGCECECNPYDVERPCLPEHEADCAEHHDVCLDECLGSGHINDHDFCYDLHQCAHSGFEPDILTECTFNQCGEECEELVEVKRTKGCDSRHFDINGNLDVTESVNFAGTADSLSKYSGNASQGKFKVIRAEGGDSRDCCQQLTLEDFLSDDEDCGCEE